jgi:hypothetical protein
MLPMSGTDELQHHYILHKTTMFLHSVQENAFSIKDSPDYPCDFGRPKSKASGTLGRQKCGHVRQIYGNMASDSEPEGNEK